ncbi:MAG: peptide ABC transporter substrate-binding protein [Alphaproteobacteria bacterium]|nr:peptide ABC transporter substrate-binding protein [Alphaproteobacteria bacterium]
MSGSHRKSVTRRSLMAAGALALAGGTALALRNAGPVRRQAADAKTLKRGNGAEPDSLDPHKAQGNWENNIIGDMFLGLMTENAAGDPVFGAAESYKVSSDGLTYTFRLRDHRWSDGRRVSARDFVFSLRRVLDPRTAGQYASILYPIRNAEPVNAGKKPLDQLAVRALDDRTLEIAFEFQVPYVAQLLSHMASFAVPLHVLERHGDDWLRAGNIVTNGPYVLTEWLPNEHIVLRKNPYFYKADKVATDTVIYYPTQDYSAALKRFRAGEFDVTNSIPSQEIDWLKSHMPRALHVAPYVLTQYLQFNLVRKPFDDIRVREALSLAINREIIATRVMRAGEKPAYSYLPRGLPGYPSTAELRFRQMAMPERQSLAKKLLGEAGFTSTRPLTFQYSYQNQNDARLTAVAFQEMWKQIGVHAQLAPAESQVHYNSLRRQDFDVAWSGWIADYRDPKNYLFIWQSSAGDMNVGRYRSREFDSLVEKSDSERSPSLRGRILARAEQILLDDMALAPIYFGVSRNLVSRQVKGWVDNELNINRSCYLSLDRSALSA